ncbi:hypothetical protein [Streptococcus suis]|uniref:hypothetical protein n=1 Tax=Streptococcus suis TaxID=1307 RepID=UPI00345C2DA9
MKQTNTFIVLRDKNGRFLAKYRNNDDALAFSATWTKMIECALILPEEHYYGKDHERCLAMAMMFDAEPIKVQAEYTLTTLDGQEPAEPVKDTEDVEDSIKKLLDILAKD